MKELEFWSVSKQTTDHFPLPEHASIPRVALVFAFDILLFQFFIFFWQNFVPSLHHHHQHSAPTTTKNFVLILFTQLSYSFHKITNNNSSKNGKKRSPELGQGNYTQFAAVHTNNWYRVKVQNFMHEYCVKLLNATATLEKEQSGSETVFQLLFLPALFSLCTWPKLTNCQLCLDCHLGLQTAPKKTGSTYVWMQWPELSVIALFNSEFLDFSRFTSGYSKYFNRLYFIYIVYYKDKLSLVAWPYSEIVWLLTLLVYIILYFIYLFYNSISRITIITHMK